MNDAFWSEIDALKEELYTPFQQDGELSVSDLIERYDDIIDREDARWFMRKLLRANVGWKKKTARRRSDNREIVVIYKT